MAGVTHNSPSFRVNRQHQVGYPNPHNPYINLPHVCLYAAIFCPKRLILEEEGLMNGAVRHMWVVGVHVHTPATKCFNGVLIRKRHFTVGAVKGKQPSPVVLLNKKHQKTCGINKLYMFLGIFP